MALNNLKEELLLQIKQHLSSLELSKTSENNYISKYAAKLKEQSKSREGEILFLKKELKEKNFPTKYKYKASTEGCTELRKIDNNNNNKF